MTLKLTLYLTVPEADSDTDSNRDTHTDIDADTNTYTYHGFHGAWWCPKCLLYGAFLYPLLMLSIVPGIVHIVCCMVPWGQHCPWILVVSNVSVV